MAKVKYSEFVEALDTADALDGTESIVVMQDGLPVESTTQDIAHLGASYLVYTALLSQTGTDAPVATVLENTLGGTVVWTRDDVGEYTATLSGAFTVNKTWFSINAENWDDGVGLLNCSWVDANSIRLISGDGDVFNRASIEIRVYP